jgi:ubiquinone biosynthesis protein Coq4
VVVCKSYNEAIELRPIEAFFPVKTTSDDNLDIIVSIVRALSETEVLEDKGPFYPVVMGLQPAIYRNW